MMESIKQGLLKSSLVGLAFLLFLGCKNIEGNNPPILECLLDKFIEYHSIKKGECINVRDHQGWTDSTSIIILEYLSSDQKTYSNQKAEYKGRTIYLELLNINSDKINKEYVICNNLEWRNNNNRSKTNNFDNKIDDIQNIQVVYYPEKRKVLELLTLSQSLNHAFIEGCQ